MDYLPAFRVDGSNDLDLLLSPEAVAFSSNLQDFSSQDPKDPARTMGDAVNRVLAAGGDCTDSKLVLSRHEIQFGKYRGQTFHWLLSEDTGYVITILAAHHQERESRAHDTDSLMQNKDALSRYALLFPRVMFAIQQLRVLDGAYDEGVHDYRRVGFGELAELSYREFYESVDPKVQSYRVWLRRARIQSMGSIMDRLQRYVLGRDHQAASSPSASPTPSVSPSSTPPSSPPYLTTSPSSSELSQAKHSRVPRDTWSPSSVDQPCGIIDSSTEEDTKPTAAELELYFSSAPDISAAPPSPAPSAPPSSVAGGLPVDILLPESWRSSLPRMQHEWMSRALFTWDQSGEPVLNAQLKNWYYPPYPDQLYIRPPASLDDVFQRPFFLWAPYMMRRFTISCPVCACKMTACGLYETVRKVLDNDGWYFMGTECLECRGCGKKLASWSRSVISQLDEGQRRMFPAVFTYRLSCDKKVFMRMEGRSLGHDVGRLHYDLVKQHTAGWAKGCLHYWSTYKKYMATDPPPPAPPEMDRVPTKRCILAAFVTDSFNRLQVMRAKVTSVFGSILKMDSSKKINRKLAGHTALAGQWVTNVGNEYEQVLMSVLTTAEGCGLQQMTSGLVSRYQQAGKEPPLVLYVNKDCCSTTGGSTAAALFPEWTQLVVRLDAWHFMLRLAAMVTTKSHPFYCNFMRRLSAAIFAWNQEDVALLKGAIEAEEPGAWSRVPLKALARHCRRRTRGAQDMECRIKETLDRFKVVKYNTVFLLQDQEKVEAIWSAERHHLHCLHDPPGLQVYIRTGQLTRGGVSLPVYSCSRGTTSLDLFHRHLNRFIPAASARAMNFQLYLLEGLTGWNQERGPASEKRTNSHPLRNYSSQYLDSVNELSQRVFGKRLIEGYSQSPEYTGELIGVNYLFSQTGQVLQELPNDPDVPDEEEEAEEEEQQQQQQEEEEEEEVMHQVDEDFQEFMFDRDFQSDT